MARKKKKVEEKEIIYAPIDEQPITENGSRETLLFLLE